MFDWDGIAVADRRAEATRIRRLVEEACAAGLELAVVSATGNVDAQLAARPAGPGGLVLALNRGSRCFVSIVTGPSSSTGERRALERTLALSRAAELTVRRLAARGACRPDRRVSGRTDARSI